MSIQVNAADSAFPVPLAILPGDQIQWGENGMSLRTHIATQVMASSMAAPGRIGIREEDCARSAVRCADLLIEALNKQKQ